MKLRSFLSSSLPGFLVTLCILTCLHPLPAISELPQASQQLLEKLRQFEKEETEKLNQLIDEKRQAVVKILEEQATDETKKGNVDGALSIRTEITELTGENKTDGPVVQKPTPAASWEIPEDAVRYKGDYYKVYPLSGNLSWEEARTRCLAVGGEIGWLDRDEDIELLRSLMQPVVDDKGHAPIWMGGVKDEKGEWKWINGEPIAGNFWNSPSDAISNAETKVMVRWIGSFKAANPDSARTIGYLCRWKR